MNQSCLEVHTEKHKKTSLSFDLQVAIKFRSTPALHIQFYVVPKTKQHSFVFVFAKKLIRFSSIMQFLS